VGEAGFTWNDRVSGGAAA
jgi:hypothetical protein